MAILTLQRRLREAGRIRIGAQVATSGGKKRPGKLDQFRLTSPDRNAIEAAAQLYGGQAQPWQGAPVGQQWEVFTDTDAMPVVIPPAATAFSQYMEAWSGGGCTRRCDGERELLTDSPCICLTEDEPLCKPTSRLSVILRDLPGLGVWRLESHGYYAATELAGTVEVIMAAATRGQLLPAVLRLEQRQVKRTGEGVKKFAVPVLDVQMTPTALGLVVGTQATGEISAPDGWKGKGIDAPAPAELGPGDSAAGFGDAVRATAEPKARRKNSPPELPSTGLNPRAAQQVAAGETGAQTPPPPHEVGPPDETEPDRTNGPSKAQTSMAMALFAEAGITDRLERLAATSAYVGRDVTSWKELSKDEASKVIDALRDSGEPAREDDGGTLPLEP